MPQDAESPFNTTVSGGPLRATPTPAHSKRHWPTCHMQQTHAVSCYSAPQPAQAMLSTHHSLRSSKVERIVCDIHTCIVNSTIARPPALSTPPRSPSAVALNITHNLRVMERYEDGMTSGASWALPHDSMQETHASGPNTRMRGCALCTALRTPAAPTAPLHLEPPLPRSVPATRHWHGTEWWAGHMHG